MKKQGKKKSRANEKSLLVQDIKSIDRRGI
jgi:hypothetical protein